MKGIRFRPEQEGLRAALFDLEADVMEVVWSAGWIEFAVADVHARLERDRDIAYTTVMTTVARLFDKGLLGRVRQGRKYLYRPALTRQAFAERMAEQVMGTLSGIGEGDRVALLAGPVRSSDAEELDRLEALIRQRRAELEE